MIQFVLNKPRNPKNIGAAARGMANFGFRELAVVAPYSVAWRETRAAVQAGPVVENAKKFKTLKQAVAASHVVIGTSAGSRRKLNETWLSLDDLPALIKKSVKAGRRVSIVFGSEKSGLSNDDLGFCRFIVKIPTVPECPSMNLAQAVAVVAHAIRREANPPVSRKPKGEGVTSENLEQLVRQTLAAFAAAQLLSGWDLKATEQKIRQSFRRWNVRKMDVAMMHRIFRWVIQKTK